MTFFKKNIKIEFLFALTGLLILLVGLIFFRSTLDIVFHDTYLVISQVHITIGLFVIIGVFSLIYFFFKKIGKQLHELLGLIHYFFTILPLLTVTIINLLLNSHIPNQGFSKEMENAEKINMIIAVTVLFCLLGQVLFFVNIIITLLRKKTN